MAGFSLPRLVYRSEKATTSAPLENIFTPKGVPQTTTLRRSAATVRTVLTGIRSNSASVWLPSAAPALAGTSPEAARPGCAESQGIEAMASV